jgi:outer membrane protein assembly factor BamB
MATGFRPSVSRRPARPRRGAAPISSRRSWPAGAAAVILAAAISGCSGSSGPASLSVHCSGHDLTAPDSGQAFASGQPLTPPVTAVPGTPRPAGTMVNRDLPDALDPSDVNYGYSAGEDWSVSRISGSGSGRPVWSLTLRVPRGVSRSEPDLQVLAQYGYATVLGGNHGQYIATVSASGRPGPACVLPPFAATDRPVDLLPHVGVIVLANPTEPAQPTGSGDDYWLDEYSTTTGQRLWSVPTGTSVAEQTADFMVDKNTVYVFDQEDAEVVAYDAATGQHLWTTDFGVNGNPEMNDNGLLAAADGRVYAMVDASTSSQILAVSDTDGKVAWKRAVPQANILSDVTVSQIARNQVLVSDSDNSEAYLLNASSGATLATQAVTSSASAPQLCDPNGQVVVAFAESGRIAMLSADPGYTRTMTILSGSDVKVAITGTVAYVRPPKAGAPVYGYDLATGERLWTVPAPGSPADAGLYAFDGGFMVQGDVTGTVYH